MANCAILWIMKNTLKEGTIRCLIYQMPEEDIYYGVALELNLSTTSASKELVMLQLQEQVEEYIKTAQEENAPELLNQEVDAELEKMWLEMMDTEQADREALQSPFVPILAISSPINAPAL